MEHDWQSPTVFVDELRELLKREKELDVDNKDFDPYVDAYLKADAVSSSGHIATQVGPKRLSGFDLLKKRGVWTVIVFAIVSHWVRNLMMESKYAVMTSAKRCPKHVRSILLL